MSDTAAFVIRSFSSLFPLLSALSILQILSAPPGLSKNFWISGSKHRAKASISCWEYLYPVAFLPYIAFLYSVVKVHCRYRGGVKFCLYSITVPLCIAAAALVPPARPAGYGQPAFECSVIRFPASPVPCGLSFCRFRWLLPLLPTFDFLPKGLLS